MNLSANNLLARIVPNCDPSETNPNLVDCDFDQLLIMGQNIVNFLITLAFIITTLMLIVGALRMITSSGSDTALKGAKDNIKAAVIGLLIVLLSWIVLNALITTFASDDCTKEWWRFKGLECSTESEDTRGGGGGMKVL